jgi:hypothetical protein
MSTMADEQVTVATFDNPAEAGALRSRLESAGIPALLSGELSATAFAGVANTVGGVRLLVPASQAERARELLAAERAEVLDEKREKGIPLTEGGRTAWVCPNCQSNVDLDIEICPKCGTVIPVEDEPGEEKAQDDERLTPTEVGDRLAHRAVVAAVVGLFVCPGLLHLYSLWVLWKLAGFKGGVTERGRWKAYTAACIDILVLTSPVTVPLCLALIGHW